MADRRAATSDGRPLGVPANLVRRPATAADGIDEYIPNGVYDNGQDSLVDDDDQILIPAETPRSNDVPLAVMSPPKTIAAISGANRHGSVRGRGETPIEPPKSETMMAKFNALRKRVSIGLWLGVFLLCLFVVVDIRPDDKNGRVMSRTLGVLLLMIVWWVTECVPIGVTGLAPLALLPLLGIVSAANVAASFINNTQLLMIGSLLISTGMEHWNLHKRISLRALMATGVKPRMILLGFLSVSFALSMWISNTAAAMIMIAIAESIMLSLVETVHAGEYEFDHDKYGQALMYGVAVATSLGGSGTLIGTAPPLVFIAILDATYQNAPDITFPMWMVYALPMALVYLALTWFYLCKRFVKTENIEIDPNIFRRGYAELGPWSWPQKVVLGAICLTAVLWCFRADVVFSGGKCVPWSGCFPGWARLFPKPDFILDGTVAIAVCVPLFAIPARDSPGSTKKVLDWEVTTKLPWSVIFLLGGGYAIALAMSTSGLSFVIGKQLQVLTHAPGPILVFFVVLLLLFFTELISNTACASIAMPLLASMASEARINPLYLMVPGVVACQYAFMLPTATPPNAIAYATGRVPIKEMMKSGLVLNIIGVLIITVTWCTWGYMIFGVEPGVFPAWAELAPPA